ncbi:hypothetical protein PHBOTO_006297 [Pseudozyma hubeiensis]|nr:hypothetical protein PHBOTO_006297 [Pseudozyma hubeiensis]
MTASPSLVRSTSRKLKTMFSSSTKSTGGSSSSSSDVESSSSHSTNPSSSSSMHSSRTSSIRRKSHRTKMPESDLSIQASTFSWTWNWDDDFSSDEDFAPVFPHFPSPRPPMLVTVEVSPRTSLDTSLRTRQDWTLLPNRALHSQDLDCFNVSYFSDDDDEDFSPESFPSPQSVSKPIPRIVITRPPPPPEPKTVRKPNKIRRKPPPSFIVEPVILVNPCTM